jgi:hypothetical protein
MKTQKFSFIFQDLSKWESLNTFSPLLLSPFSDPSLALLFLTFFFINKISMGDNEMKGVGFYIKKDHFNRFKLYWIVFKL